MGRSLRITPGGLIYHVLNRASGKMTLFHRRLDYEAFERILTEARQKIDIKIFAYQIMPNHWHLVLQPYNDGDLSKFIHWLTLTHTQRWNTFYKRVGWGHIYQGRFKSYPVETEVYFNRLCKYVESNALRAGLVKRAEYWRWSSLWRRLNGTNKEKELLSTWPILPEDDYLEIINIPLEKKVLDGVRKVTRKSAPFGNTGWVRNMAEQLNLQSTLRNKGRQPKCT